MAMADPNKLLSTSTVLWVSLKLPFTNSRLFAPFLILSLISSFPSLLFLASNQSSIYLALARPISVRVTDLADLVAFVHGLSISNCILLAVLFGISSSLTAATIHAIAMTHTGKKGPTLGDVILKTRHSWKCSCVSQVCITILHLGFILSIDPILIGLVITSSKSVVLVVLLTLVAVLAVLYYLYVAVVSLLCLVASAIEDECCGMASMGRALKLISTSRKQGVVITLLMVVLSSSVATLVFRVVCSSYSDAPQLAVGFIHICMDVVLNFLILATSTVLFYECKKSEGKDRDWCLVDVSLLADAYNYFGEEWP